MLKIVRFENKDVLESLQAFQKKHHVQIPEVYQTFLLTYNGGYTPKTSFKRGKICTDIRAFFGFGTAPAEYNFSNWEIMSVFERSLERQYLPIATDSFGNLIVIKLSKVEESICFFDHELQKYEHLTDDLKTFFGLIKSKKFVVRSVEERIQGMKDSGSDIEIDDELIRLWQAEINRYAGIKQEKVLLA